MPMRGMTMARASIMEMAFNMVSISFSMLSRYWAELCTSSWG
jgi:hypothetical protein